MASDWLAAEPMAETDRPLLEIFVTGMGQLH